MNRSPWLQVGAHRVEAAVVHQAGVIGALLRVLAVGPLHEARESIKELIHHRFMHERVIRSDAGLPGIEVLAPRDALGGLVDVGAAINDGGALAAELQRDRYQLLGSHRHDRSAHALTAGEEHMVESEAFHQRGYHLGAVPLSNSHVRGIESRCDDRIPPPLRCAAHPHWASARRSCLRRWRPPAAISRSRTRDNSTVR
jgi:hypothetical protein